MVAQYRVFLDSSAIIAAVMSPLGASYVILSLASAGELSVVISQEVQAECERTVAKKAPRALAIYRQFMQAAQPEVVSDPPIEQFMTAQSIIDTDDAPILAAAISAAPDYVVSLDRKHFLAPGVSERSGLRIGTPGDFLAWFRAQIQSQ